MEWAGGRRAWPLAWVAALSCCAGARDVRADPVSAGTDSAFELESRLEITGGTNGLLSFSDVSKQISIFAEARYRWTALTQLGGSFAYRYQSANGASDTAFQVLAGPTLNFRLESGIQNAWFVTPMVGVTTGQTSFGNVAVNSNTQFTMALSAGKRFALSPSVAYAPAVGLVKELSFSPNFTIEPISISVFF